MNKIALVLAFSISLAFSDTLYMKNGEEIKDAAVTEIDDDNVKYKIGQRQVVYVAKKADIAIILYNDGTKDIFSSEADKINIPVEKEAEKSEPKDSNDAEKHLMAARYGISFAPNFSTLGNGTGDFTTGFAIGAIRKSIIIDKQSYFYLGVGFNIELNMLCRNFVRSKGDRYETEWGVNPNTGYYEIQNTTFLPAEKNEIREYAISASISLAPQIGFLFFETGLFLNIPFEIKARKNGGGWHEYNDMLDWPKQERNIIDIGPLFALGFNIGESFSLRVGLKIMGGDRLPTDTYGDDTMIYQIETGVSYLF